MTFLLSFYLFLFISSLSAANVDTTSGSRLKAPKRAMFFFTNWSIYGRNFFVTSLSSRINDVVYAYYNLLANGTLASADPWADYQQIYTTPQPFNGNFGEFKKLLDKGRKINLRLCIGGYSFSKYFSDAVSTYDNRNRFVDSIITMFKTYPIFMGVVFRWDYLSGDGVNYGAPGNHVSKKDPENFKRFLALLGSQLDANGMSDYRIALAVPADPNRLTYSLKYIEPLLDELHLMTYDFHDGNFGDTITLPHSNPYKSSFGAYSVEEAADYYLSLGIPSTKLFVGGVTYSRGFSNTDGLGKPASGGSTDQTSEQGMVSYRQLPLPGATEFNDPESMAAYSYDPKKRVWNGYDNPKSMIEKCKMIFEKNLGGIVIWDASDDIADDQSPRSIARVLDENLVRGKPKA